MEPAGTLVECCHSYNDFDCVISYGSSLELWLSLYSAVQTRHIIPTIPATRRNGQYISVLKTLTWWLSQSLRIMQASLLPFFPLLRNITLKNMEKQRPWRNNKSRSREVLRKVFELIFHSLYSLLNNEKLVLCADGRMGQCYPVICPWTADYSKNIHFHSIEQPHRPV